MTCRLRGPSFLFPPMAAPAAATDAGVDLSLAPLDGSLRVWLFKDVENIE